MKQRSRTLPSAEDAEGAQLMGALATLFLPLATAIVRYRRARSAGAPAHRLAELTAAVLTEQEPVPALAEPLGLDSVADRATLVAAMHVSMFVVDFANPPDQCEVVLPSAAWQSYLSRSL